MMQEVSKLVEHRLDLHVREQSRLAAARRCEVAANEAEVHTRSPWLFDARNERVHPSTVTFALAREQVRVERSEQLAALVDDVVCLHVGVPAPERPIGPHLDTVQPMRRL